jgi:hypothetical protein
MKRQAGTLAILGATLCGALPILAKGNVIFFSLSLASIAVLWLSAIILILHDRSSSRVWKRLVTIAEHIEVEYATAGVGLFSTGLSILLFALPDLSGWLWLGIIMMLFGGFFIGGQIGKGVREIINYKKGANIVKA